LELLTRPLKDRGLSLVTDPIVYASMLKFFDTNLKTIDSSWRDRRSLLER
jgi:hypothetical protein